MIDTFSSRCSILRLAFSGKLTRQRKADGNARTLLSRISAKKSIEQTENTPYGIPDTWAWVKLADLFEINPKVEADDAAEAAFIPMERVHAGFERSFSFERQCWAKASKNHTKFSDGDVAFAKISPCFENRKSFIAQDLPNGIGGGTTELIVLRQSEMLPEYTYYLLLDQRFIATGKASYKGTVGQQRVQSDVIKNYFVPVPPYPEQKRIVERIEQAFSVLDTIDTLQAQYVDNLTVLKSKLIDAAIRGKLTDQLSEDGTAEELYRQIQAEKQALIKAGKIKKEKPQPEITADEIPFEIPANWKWVRLSDIATTNIGLTYHPEDIVEDGTIVVRSSNIINSRMDYADLVKVRCPIRDNQYLNNNDIVICARNGSKALVGKCAIYEGKSGTVAFGAFMAVLRTPFHRYVFYYLHTNAFRRYFHSDDSKQINQVTQDILKEALIPLPPLAEQKRIVTKLDEVLEMIGQTPLRALREKN